MKRNIFFDLDGTLLDAKKRLYLLFQHLVKDSQLSFEGYWELKKNGNTHSGILSKKFSYSEQDISAFEKTWLDKIESAEWILHDRPFDGVKEYLTTLKPAFQLYIITARQFEHVVKGQVSNFNWNGLFEEVLVTAGVKDKAGLIKNKIITSENDWLVGDTGHDIQAGKLLGLKTAAVLSGFMNKESLIKYSPDIIVDNVTALTGLS